MKRQVDTYDVEIKTMMQEATHCLCCGVQLGYLSKEKRRNRGYCSLKCFYQLPPKLAYACREWRKKPAELMLYLLSNNTVEAAAELMGVHKQAFYSWLKKYNVRRVEKWVM